VPRNCGGNGSSHQIAERSLRSNFRRACIAHYQLQRVRAILPNTRIRDRNNAPGRSREASSRLANSTCADSKRRIKLPGFESSQYWHSARRGPGNHGLRSVFNAHSASRTEAAIAKIRLYVRFVPTYVLGVHDLRNCELGRRQLSVLALLKLERTGSNLVLSSPYKTSGRSEHGSR